MIGRVQKAIQRRGCAYIESEDGETFLVYHNHFRPRLTLLPRHAVIEFQPYDAGRQLRVAAKPSLVSVPKTVIVPDLHGIIHRASDRGFGFVRLSKPSHAKIATAVPNVRGPRDFLFLAYAETDIPRGESLDDLDEVWLSALLNEAERGEDYHRRWSGFDARVQRLFGGFSEEDFSEDEADTTDEVA